MTNTLEPEQLLQTSLINGVDIGVLITDQEDTIEWANDYFCDLLGIPFDEIAGSSAISLLNLDPLIPDRSSFRIKSKRSSGEEIWLTCMQATEQKSDNQKHIVRYFVDISDLQRRQNMRLAVSSGIENSRMDPETGVLNRRTIIQELNTEISRSRRYENPLSAILIQYSTSTALDDKNAVSEQTVASGITSALRWVDIIGCLSKGCFLVVLPESTISGAEQAWNKIALQLKSVLKEQQFEVSYSDWQQDNNADEFITRLQSSMNMPKVA